MDVMVLVGEHVLRHGNIYIWGMMRCCNKNLQSLQWPLDVSIPLDISSDWLCVFANNYALRWNFAKTIAHASHIQTISIGDKYHELQLASYNIVDAVGGTTGDIAWIEYMIHVGKKQYDLHYLVGMAAFNGQTQVLQWSHTHLHVLYTSSSSQLPYLEPSSSSMPVSDNNVALYENIIFDNWVIDHAAECGHVDTVRALMSPDRPFSPNIQIFEARKHAYLRACDYGNTRLLSWILNSNNPFHDEAVQYYRSKGGQLITCVVELGYIPILRILLKHGVSFDRNSVWAIQHRRWHAHTTVTSLTWLLRYAHLYADTTPGWSDGVYTIRQHMQTLLFDAIGHPALYPFCHLLLNAGTCYGILCLRKARILRDLDNNDEWTRLLSCFSHQFTDTLEEDAIISCSSLRCI